MQDDDLCRKAVEFGCALRGLFHKDEAGAWLDHDEVARALVTHLGEAGQRVNVVRLLVAIATEEDDPEHPCFPLHVGHAVFCLAYESDEILHDQVH